MPSITSSLATMIAVALTSPSFLLACDKESSPTAPSPTALAPAQAAAPTIMTQDSTTSDELAPPTQAIAILAGGCFWGMEELLREIPGVLETEVGYTGGDIESPRYEDVKTGASGHAEAVRIVYDPSQLAFEDLLEDWFFRMHDPTTLNQQGNDRGSQYRSAIFYTSEEQRDVALVVKEKLEKKKKWSRSIVTAIVEAGSFTAAEDYHQDYLQKNPGGYTCHFMRDESL